MSIQVISKGVTPQENEIVIDAANHVMGRLASTVASLALKGKRVIIVNAERTIVTGDYNAILEQYKKKLTEVRTHYNPERTGPKTPRRPDRILRRAIRGMLPYDKEKGKKALSLVKVYLGMPPIYEKRTKYIVKGAYFHMIPGSPYTTLEELWRGIDPKTWSAWRESYDKLKKAEGNKGEQK